MCTMMRRLIAFVVLALISGLVWQPAKATQRTPPAPQSKRPMVTPCAAQPDTRQRIFLPLAHLRLFDVGEIVLNNNGIDPLVVRPTWYVTGSDPVGGRPITIPPVTMGFHNLRELLPEGLTAERVGGLSIEYDGKLMELGAQVLLRHVAPEQRNADLADRSALATTPPSAIGTGDNLDVPFSMTMDFKSNRLEATWTGSDDDDTVLVLANTAGQQIDVRLSSAVGPTTVKLGAYKSRLVKLHSARDIVGRRAMWVVMESNGLPGDLRATGFAAHRGAPPRLIRFYDPDAVLQPHLFGTRMRVAGASGDLALKNTTNEPLVARAQFLDPESGRTLFELSPTNLSANGATTVDLAPVIAKLQRQGNPDTVGVRVESNGPVGGLIGALYMRDISTGLLFDVPLRDSGQARKSTGSYPWRIDDDYETHVSITNAGSIPATFVIRIGYDGGGELVFNPMELVSGASATFDVRAIRDSRVKDWRGHALPPTATRGRFMWTVHGSGASARLIGRAEVVSANAGVTSSYSCGQCCPDSFVVGSISPFQVSMPVGGNGTYDVLGTYQTCNGSQYSLPESASWNVAFPDVASVTTPTNGQGLATGLSSGTTDVAGSYGVETWTAFVEDCVVDSFVNTDPARAEVAPSISGGNTVWYFNGQSPSGYATSVTLSSSGGASTHWTVVAGGDKVSLSAADGSQTSVTSTGTAFSSAPGDIKITASVGSATSPQFAMTTRTPHRLALGPVTTSCDSTFGYITLVGYTIQDQLITALPSGVPINEQWTSPVANDYPGTNWRQPPPQGTTLASAAFNDRIGGEALSLPPVPTPTCDGNSTPVQHWGQDWFVGSLSIGVGRRVQIDTLQKLVGRALHTGIISPTQ